MGCSGAHMAILQCRNLGCNPKLGWSSQASLPCRSNIAARETGASPEQGHRCCLAQGEALAFSVGSLDLHRYRNKEAVQPGDEPLN